MSRSIKSALEALPESGVTITVLNTLDYVVPGEWKNITDWETMITETTGVTDPVTVARIGQRAEALFQSDETNYSKALTVFETVDSLDKAVAAAALASKVGETFSFLSFLNKVTPKANTTQAVDAGVKFVAEIVAFGLLNGMPSTDNVSGFMDALKAYGKADIMRLAAWATIEGLLPLGPDFMTRIGETIGGLASSKLADNAIFAKLAANLPGASTEEKQGYVVKMIGSASDYISSFVTSRGLTQDSISSKLGGVVDVANSGMDFLAAGLDASTNYFAHTGTQTVARKVILDAWEQLQAEPDPDAGDDDDEGYDDDGYDDDEGYDDGGRTRRSFVSDYDLEEGVDVLLMDAMALAAIIDEHLSDEEEAALFELATSLPSLQNMSDFDIEEELRAALDRVAEEETETTLERLSEGLDSREDREQAFMLAATVMLSDDEVEAEEDHFIYALGQALGFRERSIEGLLDQVASFISDGEYDTYEEWYEDD